MGNTINLLAPSTVIRKRNVAQSYGKLLAAGCVFAVLLTLAAYSGYYVLNLQLSKELQSVNVQVKALGQASKEAIDTEALKARFNETATDVNRLRAQRYAFSIELDELIKITPIEIIITNVELANNPFEATIKGTANSQTAVAQFGRNLQKSKLFKDSIISSSERRVGESVFTFAISVVPGKKEDRQ